MIKERTQNKTQIIFKLNVTKIAQRNTTYNMQTEAIGTGRHSGHVKSSAVGYSKLYNLFIANYCKLLIITINYLIIFYVPILITYYHLSIFEHRTQCDTIELPKLVLSLNKMSRLSQPDFTSIYSDTETWSRGCICDT